MTACTAPMWMPSQVPQPETWISDGEEKEDPEKENVKPKVRAAVEEPKSHPRTVIILDWDDTLFPLTYVRNDLRLDPFAPLQEQPLPEAMKQDVGQRLAKCADEAAKLLSVASSLGKVILVTLSRDSWVEKSCQNFCPELQDAIESTGLHIVYAQPSTEELSDRSGDCTSKSSRSPAEEQRYWSDLKAKAIGQILVDGQTCTNIISIGDSEFERLGTRKASQEYASRFKQSREAGGDDLYRVRTKTFKTMEKPTADELTAQLSKLSAWLPNMVASDDDFDMKLLDIDSRTCIQAIEQALRP
eukprot:TRINITY_DN61548_c0_g1_i1.p1 TRINITY_DN61548_c0_g1~~TRINITY_DN61548_c0_g1_i1.p1  ORF type:complete len:301 (+),score=66.22 TRINITY_DN61548_c0_g1_i1:151-1053(+)